MLTLEEQNKINQGSIDTANRLNSNAGIGVSFPSVISSSSLTPVTPVQLPPPPAPQDYNGIASAASAGAKTAPTTFTTPNGATIDVNGNIISYAPQKDTTKTFSDRLTAAKDYVSSMFTTPKNSTDEFYNLTGLTKEQVASDRLKGQQDVNDLTAQLAEMDAKALANQEKALNSGETSSFAAGEAQRVARNDAIQRLLVSSKLNAAQGRLDAANGNIKTIMDMIRTDFTNQTNYQNKVFDEIFNVASKDEANALAEKKTQMDNFNDLKKTAIQQAYNVRDYATASKILDAKNETELNQLVSGIQGNSLDDQYKKLQIQKLESDIAAANANDAAVDPSVLQGMLNVYQSTGVLPSFGLGAKSPLRAQFYAALGGANGAQMVNDANTNKAVRAGLQTAYKTQQNQYAANQTAIATLDKQLDLAKQYSDKVSRSGSPLVAKYVIGMKSGVFGDPDAAALNNIVKTASYEFAKILSGSAASVGGVTVSSASDAETLLNSAMSKGQFNTVMNLMKSEANYRLQSQKDTINQYESDLKNVGQVVSDGVKATQTSGYLVSPDGKQKVKISDLSAEQQLEAKNAGWK